MTGDLEKAFIGSMGEAMTMTQSVLDPGLERTSNRVELVGYVGRRPELRYTTRLEPVAQLSVATHRWREDEQGLQQLTDWHRLVAYGDLAHESHNLRPGELVRVIGQLRTRGWTDSDSHRQLRTEVVLEELHREPSRPRPAQLSFLMTESGKPQSSPPPGSRPFPLKPTTTAP